MSGSGRSSESEALRCTAAAIRRAARRTTQFYDEALKPLGLRLTQYSLLSNIAALDRPTITELADRLVMDRTTLTRNLAPLRTAGWVQLRPGMDKRSRAIVLTEDGEAKLADAEPVWQQAEIALRAKAGERRTRDLRRLLDEVAVAMDGDAL